MVNPHPSPERPDKDQDIASMADGEVVLRDDINKELKRRKLGVKVKTVWVRGDESLHRYNRPFFSITNPSDWKKAEAVVRRKIRAWQKGKLDEELR